MKSNYTNILIGAIVIAMVAYILYPKIYINEGFESSPGAILGSVFAGILGLGILVAFLSALFQ